MSHTSTAFNQITRHGYQGAAKLVNQTPTVSDLDVTLTTNTISLYAFIATIPSSKMGDNNDKRTNLKILARVDSRFNGTVNTSAKVIVRGMTLDVVSSVPHYIKDTIAYVEIIANG